MGVTFACRSHGSCQREARVELKGLEEKQCTDKTDLEDWMLEQAIKFLRDLTTSRHERH